MTSKPFSLNSRRARHKNQAFHRQCDEAPALPAFHRRGEAKVSGEGRIALADSIAATLGGLREAVCYIREHLGYSLSSLLDEKQPLTFAHTGAVKYKKTKGDSRTVMTVMGSLCRIRLALRIEDERIGLATRYRERPSASG